MNRLFSDIPSFLLEPLFRNLAKPSAEFMGRKTLDALLKLLLHKSEGEVMFFVFYCISFDLTDALAEALQNGSRRCRVSKSLHLRPVHFLPILKSLIESHPGLAFLKSKKNSKKKIYIYFFLFVNYYFYYFCLLICRE